jgi:hypothetical protein
MLNWLAFNRFLAEACEHYERTAPTVAAYCNGLYVRLSEKPAEVSALEVIRIPMLKEGAGWMQPNYAANFVYKLMSELNQPTTGHTGF